MSRADPPIRQWTILKVLESHGRVTLRQIADALRETCHERTLRRDLDVLGLVGFPKTDRCGGIEDEDRHALAQGAEGKLAQH